MLYLSLYPKGLKSILSNILRFYVKDVEEIFYLDDTAISYRTDSNWDEIGKLECFETSFLLIRLVKDIDKKSLRNLYTWAMSNQVFYQKVNDFSNNKYSFRIVDSGLDHDKRMFVRERERLESRLFSYGVKIDRGHPDFEIRFVEKYKFSFIGIRVSKPPQYKDDKQKGSLRKEIISVMLYLSEPNSNDVFLDPFCGSGAIPIKRAKLSPYKEIIATDKSTRSLKTNEFKKFTIKELNYTQLSKFYNHKITKIVTDPPWGLIEKVSNIQKFYNDVFKELKEIMKEKGIIIVCVKDDRVLDKILHEDKDLELINKISVKISGLSAFIFKIVYK